MTGRTALSWTILFATLVLLIFVLFRLPQRLQERKAGGKQTIIFAREKRSVARTIPVVLSFEGRGPMYRELAPSAAAELTSAPDEAQAEITAIGTRSAANLSSTTASPVPGRGQIARLESKAGGGKVRIEGTSTIHDWQVESTIIGGRLEAGHNFPLEPGEDVKPDKVDARVEAYIPVQSLKSIEKDGTPYSDRMDEVMYEHLKQPTSPRIYYRLSEFVLRETPTSKDLPYVFDSKGELAVAGVTNSISMPVEITPLGNKTVKVTGNTIVKMSSFGIEPPAVMGIAIKSGDEVKLVFEWTVAQKVSK